MVRDLIATTSSPVGSSAVSKDQQLEVRQTPDGRAYVQGATSIQVPYCDGSDNATEMDGGDDNDDDGDNDEEMDRRQGKRMLAFARDVIRRGDARRRTGAHQMNQRSSRSHAILTVTCQMLRCGKGGEASRLSGEALGKGEIDGNPSDDHDIGSSGSGVVVGESRCSFVDLAGSERVRKTEAAGERLKEAQSINLSLLALGDVVSALARQASARQKRKKKNDAPSLSTASSSPSSPSAPSSFAPFRNSTLTFLLQSSLSLPSSKVLVICTIDGAPKSVGETISSLDFAQRCTRVELADGSGGDCCSPHTKDEPEDQGKIQDLEAKLRVAEMKLKQQKGRPIPLRSATTTNLCTSDIYQDVAAGAAKSLPRRSKTAIWGNACNDKENLHSLTSRGAAT